MHITPEEIEKIVTEIIEDSKRALHRNAESKEFHKHLRTLQKRLEHQHARAHHTLASLIRHAEQHVHRPIIEMHSEVMRKARELKQQLLQEQDDAAYYGSQKIRSGSHLLIYGTHDTLLSFLLHTLEKRKPHTIHLLDAHPFWAGKHWVGALRQLHIPIVYHSFAQVEHAIQQADIIFLGCAYVTSDFRAVTVTGSTAIARLARYHGVPVYLCLHSWDYHPSAKHITLEKSSVKHSLLSTAHKHVTADTIYQELLPLHELTGIISEKGILTPEVWKTRI